MGAETIGTTNERTLSTSPLWSPMVRGDQIKPRLALPCLASPRLASPRQARPRRALPCLARPSQAEPGRAISTFIYFPFTQLVKNLVDAFLHPFFGLLGQPRGLARGGLGTPFPQGKDALEKGADRFQHRTFFTAMTASLRHGAGNTQWC
jgi:hypothetical protein